MRYTITYCFYLISLITLSGCIGYDRYEVCNERTNVDLIMNTYLRVSNNETSFSSPALTLIEAPGINLYSSTAGISEIKTKLSPNIDSVVYVIKRNISTPFDTIKIKYSNAKYNPGPNCIPVDVFRILNATTTTHDIKNIVVTKADVNTSGGENIRIVY